MDIEAYVESLSVGDDEKRRTRSDLAAFLKILASHGRTFPEECDYQEYRTQKSTDKNTKTTEDRIRRIKRYFDTFLKGEAHMTIPETQDTAIIPAENSEKQPQQQHYETSKGGETISYPADPVRAGDSSEPKAPSTLEASEKKSPRMGAPRKSAELRDKKIMIYITASLEEDVKDLARIDGKTTPDYIFRLIEREATKRANDLKLIRNMRQQNA